GLALCVPRGGSDSVVSASSADRSQASLGFVGRQVLARAEAELRKGRIVASTPGFALFVTPSVQKVGATHVKVLLVYAFLVDGSPGAPGRCGGPLAAAPPARLPPTRLVLLPPSLVDACGLDVAAERWLGVVPANWSFAMRALPPGRSFAVNDAVRRYVARP